MSKSISGKYREYATYAIFDLNEDATSPLKEVDPDMNYYKGMQDTCLNACDYYFGDSFNKKWYDLDIGDDSFSVLHTNIRSIPKNVSHFENYVKSLKLSFTTIALSETWLKQENKSCYDIKGYNAEHNVRHSKNGGGVSLVVRSGLEYHLRPDLAVMSDVLESLFIEFDKEVINRNSNMIVGVLYRPPGTDINDFVEEFSKMCSKIRTERKICYITGDYNINLLNNDKHLPTSEFYQRNVFIFPVPFHN